MTDKPDKNLGIKVTDKDIGRLVVYDPGYKIEQGVITSYNDTYVFVRYGADIHPKATYPRDLRYVNQASTNIRQALETKEQ